MFDLNNNEVLLVSGGDAAATRLPGTNSWGEAPGGGLNQRWVDCVVGAMTGGGSIFGLMYCNITHRRD